MQSKPANGKSTERQVSPLRSELNCVAKLSILHGERGRALLRECGTKLFPCDILALSVLDRSLSLIKGFVLLIRNGGYIPAVGLLRMQLDSVLRFSGIIRTGDPHGLANDVLSGRELRTLKDTDGKLMSDARLRQTLSADNPWLDGVYKLSSGYIHLSDHHVRHLLQRSEKNPSGSRQLTIGNEDGYLTGAQRLELVVAFAVITQGVLDIEATWIEVRLRHGNMEELSRRFVREA